MCFQDCINMHGVYEGPAIWRRMEDQVLLDTVSCKVLNLDKLTVLAAGLVIPSRVEVVSLKNIRYIGGNLDIKKALGLRKLETIEGTLYLADEGVESVTILPSLISVHFVAIEGNMPVPFMPELDEMTRIRHIDFMGEEHYGDLTQRVLGTPIEMLVPLRSEHPVLANIIDARLKGLL